MNEDKAMKISRLSCSITNFQMMDSSILKQAEFNSFELNSFGEPFLSLS